MEFCTLIATDWMGAAAFFFLKIFSLSTECNYTLQSEKDMVLMVLPCTQNDSKEKDDNDKQASYNNTRNLPCC